MAHFIVHVVTPLCVHFVLQGGFNPLFQLAPTFNPKVFFLSTVFTNFVSFNVSWVVAELTMCIMPSINSIIMPAEKFFLRFSLKYSSLLFPSNLNLYLIQLSFIHHNITVIGGCARWGWVMRHAHCPLSRYSQMCQYRSDLNRPLVHFRFFHQSLNVSMAHHPITHTGGYRSIKISAYAAG